MRYLCTQCGEKPSIWANGLCDVCKQMQEQKTAQKIEDIKKRIIGFRCVFSTKGVEIVKKFFAVSRTQHYTDYYIVEIEGENEDEMEERVRALVQQEMVDPYHTKPRADDCDVDMNEIGEDGVQKIEREFGCERERSSSELLANTDK